MLALTTRVTFEGGPRQAGRKASRRVCSLTSYTVLIAITLLVYVHALLGRVEFQTNRAVEQASVSALYLINIIFFVGASAGAMVLGTIVRASRIKRMRTFSEASKIGAATGLAVAMMFVALDMARGGHLWWHASVDLVSAVLAEMPITAIYIAHAIAIACVVSQFDLIVGIRNLPARRMPDYVLAIARMIGAGASTRRTRATGGLLAKWLIPAALLLRSIPIWMEALTEIGPGTRTLLIAAPCYVSCVVSGLAFAVLLATARRSGQRCDGDDAATLRFGHALGIALPLLGYGVFAELWMTMEARDPIRHHLFAELVVGSYAPFFWFALAGGMIVPFFLLISTPAATIARVRLAAFLTILGVFVVRWTTVVPALLGHAHTLYAAGGYAPSASEAFPAIAVYVMGFLSYLALIERGGPLHAMSFERGEMARPRQDQTETSNGATSVARHPRRGP